MTRTVRAGRLLWFWPVSLILFGLACSAAAIDRCDAVCNADCQLTRDLVCCPTCADGNGPIKLLSGADLDMNGHSIQPGSGAGHNSPYFLAVLIQGSNSIVKNASTNVARVVDMDVECIGFPGSRVTGIRFEFGRTQECAKVDGSVFIGGFGDAIFTDGVANTDRIHDNYLDLVQAPGHATTRGITVVGDKGVNVDHNFIHYPDGLSNNPAGIDVSNATSSSVAVRDNVFYSGTTIIRNDYILGNGIASFQRNYCDVGFTQCLSCITSGFCTDPGTPPFVAP